MLRGEKRRLPLEKFYNVGLDKQGICSEIVKGWKILLNTRCYTPLIPEHREQQYWHSCLQAWRSERWNSENLATSYATLFANWMLLIGYQVTKDQRTLPNSGIRISEGFSSSESWHVQQHHNAGLAHELSMGCLFPCTVEQCREVLGDLEESWHTWTLLSEFENRSLQMYWHLKCSKWTGFLSSVGMTVAQIHRNCSCLNRGEG